MGERKGMGDRERGCETERWRERGGRQREGETGGGRQREGEKESKPRADSEGLRQGKSVIETETGGLIETKIEHTQLAANEISLFVLTKINYLDGIPLCGLCRDKNASI